MTRVERLVRHYSDFWKAMPRLVKPSEGRARELPSDFRIVVLPPGTVSFTWVYATAGISQAGDVEPIELHLLSREPHDEHVSLLPAITHYHRTGAPLGLGHTVNFGVPWLPGSACDHGLISLPYLWGPTLERFADDATPARCLWLIPIMEAEREYKKAHGLDALESLFEQHQLRYLDPHRPSVVPG